MKTDLLKLNNFKPAVLKNNFLHPAGQSLLEVIVALAVFSLFAASITSFILGSLHVSSEGGAGTRADMLAREAQEALRTIRDRAWNELEYGQRFLSKNNGFWELSEIDPGIPGGGFVRTIEINPVYRNQQKELSAQSDSEAYLDPETKEITVTVSRQNTAGAEVSVIRRTYLSNWESGVWEQSDWSLGDGQDIFLESEKYFSDDGNIDFSFDGELRLSEVATATYASIGYLVSSAFDIGDGAPGLIFVDFEKPSECVSCEVSVQIISAPDNNGSPGEWTLFWSGPDGIDNDESDYYEADSNGVVVNSDHNGDRWFRYKLILKGEEGFTPRVFSIKLDYGS